jgi:hypothetical protein
MDEYVMTVLLEDHRRELLAEARNEALARQVLAGRKPWWRRLVRRSGDVPAEHAGTPLDAHMAAPVLNAR